MLVLSRKRGEAITIGGGITLKVIEIRGNRVKLGFDCPADVRIVREEILHGLTGIREHEMHESMELVAS